MRTLEATLLTYFVKISDVNSQAGKVYQWNMQTRVRPRVRARGRLDLVGDADLIYLFERKLHSS